MKMSQNPTSQSLKRLFVMFHVWCFLRKRFLSIEMWINERIGQGELVRIVPEEPYGMRTRHETRVLKRFLPATHPKAGEMVGNPRKS